ncbi:MAG: Nif3-like dinuclear metal center hexameric protein, partial [Anaerolineae bacterium]
MKRDKLIDYLDGYLRVAEIEDESQNGLQVEGPDEVGRVAFAVDACLASFNQAVAEGVQLLIVHHGLFWSKPQRLVGPHFDRLKTLIEGRCGLYAVHLPLDAHPEVGNNAEMARLLRLDDTRPFGVYHGLDIGVAGVLEPPLDLPALIGRLIEALGTPPIRVLDHGPDEIRTVGCVSGAAASMMDQAADEGLDAYITGETSHVFFHQAAERGLNVLFAGHYATEALGVQALARHLEARFELDAVFLHIPTGM